MRLGYQKNKRNMGQLFIFIWVMVLMTLSPRLQAEGIMSRILFFQESHDSPAQSERTMKDLLRRVIDNTVFEVSQVNGFYHQSELRLDLPEKVKGIEKISKKFNVDLFWHNFQLGLNRAAESAAPKAGVLMKNALEELTFDKDPQEILEEEGSLTQYFRRKMMARLQEDFQLIMERSVSNQDALQPYVELKCFFAAIPFKNYSSKIFNIEKDAAEKALDGIFLKMEEEEVRIRSENREFGKVK